jgi:hypothetical protein
MVGLTISAIAPNNDRAISLVPIILLPQVIFSGAIIPLKDWVTQILATGLPYTLGYGGAGFFYRFTCGHKWGRPAVWQ